MRRSLRFIALVLPLCSGMRTPLVAPRVNGAVRTSPIVAAVAQQESPANTLATQLVMDSSPGVAEPENWRWIDGSGVPVASFDDILDAIRSSQASFH